MTVRRAKNMLQHQNYMHVVKKNEAIASSYFKASLIALLFAVIVVMLGLVAIGDTVDSYFEEKPMINIVLPPQV